MAIIWGLAAAISYGVADFIARDASHREGSLKTLLYLNLVGSAAAAIVVAKRGCASAMPESAELEDFLAFRQMTQEPTRVGAG